MDNFSVIGDADFFIHKDLNSMVKYIFKNTDKDLQGYSNYEQYVEYRNKMQNKNNTINIFKNKQSKIADLIYKMQ